MVPYQHGRSEGISETGLQSQRVDFLNSLTWEFREDGPFPLLDRLRGMSKISTPFYSAANWTDTEVHSPGNILGFMHAAPVKFLETHSGDHFNSYYGSEGVKKQRAFLDCFLKTDADFDALKRIPKVDLLIRQGSSSFRRTKASFPPHDTEYQEYYLSGHSILQRDTPKEEIVSSFDSMSGNSFFVSDPLEEDFELLGFPYLALNISTSAKDTDIFLTISNIGPAGNLLRFEGNHGEDTVSVTRGYLRLSHRELDLDRSTEHLPILKQQRHAEVVAGKKYSLKMPVQPTSMIFEKGHRIQIEIGGRDSETLLSVMRHEGADRTTEQFGGTSRIHGGSKIVLPFVRRN